MFDGITDIGMDQVNAMGKQSRFRNWKPNWDARDDLKRNQNLYSGWLTELSLLFSAFFFNISLLLIQKSWVNDRSKILLETVDGRMGIPWRSLR